MQAHDGTEENFPDINLSFCFPDENQARILREEQEARERMLRGPELPPNENPLDEEKENMVDGGAKKHGHHKHGSGGHRHGEHGHKHREHGHKHREHGHKHGELSYKNEEDVSEQGEEAQSHVHRHGGHRHKHEEHAHKHGEHGHKHRENARELGRDSQAREGEDGQPETDLGGGIGGENPTRDGNVRTSEVRRSSRAMVGDGSFHSEGSDGIRSEAADGTLASSEEGSDGEEMRQRKARMHGPKRKHKKKVKADGRKGDGHSGGSVREGRKASVRWAESGDASVQEIGRSAGEGRKSATRLGGEAERTEEDGGMAAERNEDGGRTAERNGTRAEGEAAFEQESDGDEDESVSGSDSGSGTEGAESGSDSSAGEGSDSLLILKIA